MNPKTPILLTLLVVLGAGAFDLAAQDRRGDDFWRHGPPGATEQLARLERALDLSDEQALELLDVLQQAEAERADLHARAMEQLRPEICAQQSETEARILAVLNDEQAETFRALKEQREQRLADRQGRGRGPQPPDCGENG